MTKLNAKNKMMRPEPFFDRRSELAALDRGWRFQSGGQMAMVYGRRRLGKTYLLQRYFSSGTTPNNAPRPHCYYLAEQSSVELQRLVLAERLLDAFPSVGYAPEEIAISWNAMFRYMTLQASDRPRDGERIALILDEFPYLVAQTPELPSMLQSWWDSEGVHLPIYLVLCGSQLSAMSALGRETAPLFGRFNAGILRIEPLRYDDAASFYEGKSLYGTKEKLVMYGVLGGTPRYHAMVDSRHPFAEQVVDLLMRPGSPLESEVRFLLSSEQIRDPAPYNAILNTIARGRTQYGEIKDAVGVEASALAHQLKSLQELGWIWRESPFGESPDRRALYRIADPFLLFWYRFVAPLASAFQFSDPMKVYKTKVEPFLADYMGWNIFESICQQWLQKHADTQLGLTIRKMARYWSRDGKTEIDIVAEMDDGSMLFGECKWSARTPLGIGMYADLRAKVSTLPNRKWTENASYVLFSFGGFAPELRALASSEDRLHLVNGSQLL